MASRTAARASEPQKAPATNNDIDDYDVDDDPFADSAPEDPPQKEAPSKKRKDASGLGIDEEVAVAKKVRAPAVKLDETRYVFQMLSHVYVYIRTKSFGSRLLSEKGIPRLRRKARDLKFKGKGHEVSDTSHCPPASSTLTSHSSLMLRAYSPSTSCGLTTCSPSQNSWMP